MNVNAHISLHASPDTSPAATLISVGRSQQRAPGLVMRLFFASAVALISTSAPAALASSNEPAPGTPVRTDRARFRQSPNYQQLIRPQLTHDGCTELQFCDSHRQLISLGGTGSVRLWDVDRGTLIQELPSRGVVDSMCVIPGTAMLVTAETVATEDNASAIKIVCVWDTTNIASGARTLFNINEQIPSLASSLTWGPLVAIGESQCVAIGFNDAHVIIISTVDGSFRMTKVPTDGYIANIVVAEPASGLLVAQTGTLTLLDHSTGNVVWSVSVPTSLGAIAVLDGSISASSSRPVLAGFVAEPALSSLALWDTRTGEAVAPLRPFALAAARRIVCMECDRTGTVLTVGSDDGTWCVLTRSSDWRPVFVSPFANSTPDRLALLPRTDFGSLPPLRVTAMAATSDAIAVAAAWSNEVSVIDVHTLRKRIGSSNCFPDAAVLAHGTGLAVLDGTRVRVVDGRTGNTENLLIGGGARLTRVAVSPSGESLLAGADDGTVSVWRLEGQEAHHLFRPSATEIIESAFGVGVDEVVTVDALGEMVISNTRTDEAVRFQLQLPEAGVERARFYGGRCRMASLGDHGRRMCWCVVEDIEWREDRNGVDVACSVGSIEGKERVGGEWRNLWTRGSVSVLDFAVAPDGKALLVANGDGSIERIDMTSGEVVERLDGDATTSQVFWSDDSCTAILVDVEGTMRFCRGALCKSYDVAVGIDSAVRFVVVPHTGECAFVGTTDAGLLRYELKAAK